MIGFNAETRFVVYSSCTENATVRGIVRPLQAFIYLRLIVTSEY